MEARVADLRDSIERRREAERSGEVMCRGRERLRLLCAARDAVVGFLSSPLRVAVTDEVGAVDLVWTRDGSSVAALSSVESVPISVLRRERCSCGHERGAHADELNGHAVGHGACSVRDGQRFASCPCRKFTWAAGPVGGYGVRR